MYITHIATELNPIAKVGGLGDVVYGLSKELSRSGHQVEVILPKYDCIDYSQLHNLKVEFRELISFEGFNRFNNTIWSAEVENLKIKLIETHHPRYYFTRGVVYGCPDDNDRFIYFSRTAMEYLYKSGKRPDILHLHDWPTALIAPLYKEMYAPLGMKIGGTLLTIHNLEHQGRCSVFNVEESGLSGRQLLTPEKMQDPYRKEDLNLLKGGIVYADGITTVSPSYEREIKTAAGGCGLQSTLQTHVGKLRGILNGIDEDFWNPEIDPHLIKKYPPHRPLSKKNLPKILSAKLENKAHVRKHACMRECSTPLVVSITRLATQKGPELIRHAILRTLENGGQFILLGSAGDSDTYKSFEKIKDTHPQRDNLFLCFEKDEAFAHLLFAAADMIIVPSLFEPCGLTQLIGLRYGTVPIVRKTGGLADTVFDIETATAPLKERNGYSFDFPDAQGVYWALDRAFACWRDRPEEWKKLVEQGIDTDFSWKHQIPKYIEFYREIISTELG